MFMTVFRDMAHTGSQTFPNRHMSDIHPVQGDRTAGHRFESGKPIDKFSLTVSIDSCNADDLTSSNLQRYLIDCIILMPL